MKLKLLSCEVIFREMCDSVVRSPHQVDVEFMPKGLHDLGGKTMAAELQKLVDSVPEGKYDAIILGYALCGNGLSGLTARHTPLVMVRAHDCIAILMGSRAKYEEYFRDNPGAFYRSTGWLERGKGLQQLTHSTAGMDDSLERLIAKYGEDNGRFLYEEMTGYRNKYQKLTFIATGLEPDGRFEDEARSEAAGNGWGYERYEGDLNLLRRLAGGDWQGDDFIVVKPGERMIASYDAQIIRVEEIGKG
jgi:hypothetical protein